MERVAFSGAAPQDALPTIEIDDRQAFQPIEGFGFALTGGSAYLLAGLAAADRANHPFIVALSHRGLFSTSLHSEDSDVLAARAALAPLYDQYNVDLAVNGHDHEYERSLPILSNTSNPSGAPTIATGGKGTTYIISAGAGADPYAVGTSAVAYRATKTAFGSGTPYIGLYGTLQITATQLTWTAYGMVASGSTMADDTVINGPLTFQAR